MHLDHQLRFRVMTFWRRWSRDHLIPDVPSHGCSFGTEPLSPTVSEKFGIQNSSIFASKYMCARSWLFRVTWRYRTRDRLIPQVPISYRCATVTSLYVRPFSKYLTPNISGSRPWPFKVMWRHQSCDHLIRHMPFCIDDPLEPSIYLHWFLRYLHPNIFGCKWLFLGSRDVISHMAIASWNK